MSDTYPVSDFALSQRLERCEAKTNAALIEARARLWPESGARWIECAGAYALFDGVRSPLTQTFCLGMPATPSVDDLKTIERFLADREADVFHEVSPLTGMETLDLLVSRGYRPIELTSILYRPISPAFDIATGRVRARQASPDESDLWSSVAAEGWGETPELGDFMRDIGRISMASEGMTAFLAEIDGRAAGTGAVAIHDGVALLAGASTIPAARNQGAQQALLEARLRHAAANGCDLAMMGASPGSASQRNAERQGFRIAYTRIKWSRGGAERDVNGNLRGASSVLRCRKSNHATNDCPLLPPPSLQSLALGGRPLSGSFSGQHPGDRDRSLFRSGME